MRTTLSTILAGIGLIGTAHADNLVCGNGKIVQPGMTTAEVIGRCGTPTSKETKTEDVRATGPAGGAVKVGESVTETWRYDRGSRKQTAVLIVREGKIVSIRFE